MFASTSASGITSQDKCKDKKKIYARTQEDRERKRERE